MKRKENFFIDVKEKKIKKGKEYNWNTLIINTTKLKWNQIYRQKCIERFADMMQKRKEVKPIKIKYQTGKKRYFSSKINNLTKGVYVSKTEINIINANEQQIKIINELKIKD